MIRNNSQFSTGEFKSTQKLLQNQSIENNRYSTNILDNNETRNFESNLGLINNNNIIRHSLDSNDVNE